MSDRRSGKGGAGYTVATNVRIEVPDVEAFQSDEGKYSMEFIRAVYLVDAARGLVEDHKDGAMRLIADHRGGATLRIAFLWKRTGGEQRGIYLTGKCIKVGSLARAANRSAR